MALLWNDGFDHYGTDEGNLLDGVYAQADTSEVRLATSLFATGTTSMEVYGRSSEATKQGLRKVLPASTDKIGAMGRFYFAKLPNENTISVIFDFLTATPNTSQVACIVDANGCLRFYRGQGNHAAGNGTLIAQTDPIIVASAWNHIEVQLYIHDTTGWIRVAVNGVHRYQATNLDTKQNSDNVVSVMQYHRGGSNADGDFFFDDYIVYNFSGSSAVDTDFCPTTDGSGIATNYIGELQCMYLPVNGDTSQMNWVASSGTDEYAMIDETTPNDADYISSSAAGNLSEFSVTDLPADITYIRGLQLIGRMDKSDSGSAMTKFGMKSVATYSDASERPVTTEPTYWWDFLNTDPNTGAATGTLTFTGQPADNDTVTIGTKTYTFQTVLTNVDGNIFIGATLAATIANFEAAIELGAGSGTAYAAATTLNTQVTATAGATTLVITAKESGTGGNSIGTTETSANASWGGATMSGGSSGTRWTRSNLNAAWFRLTRSV